MKDLYGKEAVLEILMKRDGVTREEAEYLFVEARELVEDGYDPEDILKEEFGLEPDYLFALFE